MEKVIPWKLYKKSVLTILMSDNADFRRRNLIKNKEGKYVNDEGQFSKKK